MDPASTIFALATVSGRAGIAVFRISGKRAFDVLSHLCRPKAEMVPRTMSLRTLVNPVTGDLLDQALVVGFQAPHSFTGENVMELHVHGGRAIVSAIASALGAMPDFRPAEAGEFTRRAFENGRLDLTEAEAIADLINAETESQRRQALRQFEGGLHRLYEEWRSRLTRVLAYVEASIDFSEEELPTTLADDQRAVMKKLIQDIQHHLDDHRRGERIRSGFLITLLGKPNAGKSSLLNILAQREAAIVSSIAGTTRDIVEVNLDLGGYAVTLADTAGLRETADVVEQEGVRRALRKAEEADLKIVIMDAGESSSTSEKDRDALFFSGDDDKTIIVMNKVDLLDKDQRDRIHHQMPRALLVSAKNNDGIVELLSRIVKEIERRYGDNGTPALTQVRHRTSLLECCDHLSRSLEAPASELIAEDIRLASRALGRITGYIDVDDVLDVIFRDFCIGK